MCSFFPRNNSFVSNVHELRKKSIFCCILFKGQDSLMAQNGLKYQLYHKTPNKSQIWPRSKKH